MKWARWERFAPLTGVVAVVLWVVGTYILEKTDRPEGKDSAAFAAWVSANETELITGTIVFGFGVVLFLWFLGSLRAALMDAEGGTGRLTAIAYGSGVATAVMMLATYLPHAKAAFDNENMTDSAVESVVLVGDSFFGGVELFAIPLLLATALVIWRTGVLPVWFAWFSFVLAVVLAIIPIGWAGVLLGLPLWTLAGSWLVYARGRSATAATPGAPPPMA